MTAREFISFLYRKGATDESPICGVSPLFTKGALSNWRFLSRLVVNVGSLTRFITINNLEDYEVRDATLRKLYRSNVKFELRNDDNFFTVNICQSEVMI